MSGALPTARAVAATQSSQQAVSPVPASIPNAWQPMDTAPKDQPVLVSYDHDADPYQDPQNPGKLTSYACHAEGGDFLGGQGVVIAKWSEGWWEDDGWESANPSYWMPAVWSAWFNGEYADQVVNPIAWMPLPAIATEALSTGGEK